MAEMTVGPPASDDNLFCPVPVAMLAERVSEAVGLLHRGGGTAQDLPQPPEGGRPASHQAAGIRLLVRRIPVLVELVASQDHDRLAYHLGGGTGPGDGDRHGVERLLVNLQVVPRSLDIDLIREGVLAQVPPYEVSRCARSCARENYIWGENGKGQEGRSHPPGIRECHSWISSTSVLPECPATTWSCTAPGRSTRSIWAVGSSRRFRTTGGRPGDRLR